MNKKNKNFNFSIGSDLDYEDLVADIGFNNQLLALLTQEEGYENMKIKIYSRNGTVSWEFRLDEFEEILSCAKQRLWELRKIPETDDES